jgi:8-oxo-dGTP pyrophosphatase MutT (NUDIX family)
MSDYYRSIRRRVGNDLLMVPSVAAIIRDDRGRTLFQRKHDGSWSLPAGAIEPGEGPELALAREVLEETGLEVRPVRVLGVFGGEGFRVTYDNGDLVEYTVAVYECEVTGGSLAPTDHEETAELSYRGPTERPALRFAYPDRLFTRRP